MVAEVVTDAAGEVVATVDLDLPADVVGDGVSGPEVSAADIAETGAEDAREDMLETLLEGAASPAKLHQRLDAAMVVIGAGPGKHQIDEYAAEKVGEHIDSRVALQLAAIADGVESCPAVPLVGESEADSEQGP